MLTTLATIIGAAVVVGLWWAFVTIAMWYLNEGEL